MIAGALPPSSSSTRFSPAMPRIRSPIASLPVNPTTSTSGLRTSGSPTSASPWITLSTPGGSPALVASSASMTATSAPRTSGLWTTVFPAPSAGAILWQAVLSGALNGVIAATTPIG